MSQTDVQFSPNDLLLDQTMLCDASRLIGGHPAGRRRGFARGSDNSERLLNLSLLLDGMALHDKLYVLGAELPSEVDGLQFRNLLLEKKIVRELSTVPNVSSLTNDLDTFLRKSLPTQENYEQQYNYNSLIRSITKVTNTFLESKSPSYYDYGFRVGGKGVLDGLRRVLEGRYSLSGSKLRLKDVDLESKPFLAIGQYILKNFRYFVSGTFLDGVSQLRTFVYLYISGQANIPLYPSSQRIPQIDALMDHMRLSVSDEIYQIVANSFKESVEVIYKDEVRTPVFLPPSLAIFFDLYRSSGDLSRTIDDFRGEFTGVRKELHNLEEKHANATTLRERIEIKRAITNVTSSIKKDYQLGDDLVLETAFGFSPEALNPFLNPSEPTKYSNKLLVKSQSWIKNWWLRRPFRHVFQLRKRLYDIANYEGLASDVLGVEFSEREKEFFLNSYDRSLARYGSKAPSKDKNVHKTSNYSKIKILFLAANPASTTRLRIDRESRAIDQALRRSKLRSRFDFKQHWSVRVNEIAELLLRYEPNIVHFSGHGNSSNEIIIEDDSGNAYPLPTHALSQLFSVLKDNIQCVLLNTCYSENQSIAISKHVDCVIGMSKAIGELSAISFAASFYQALGYGRNVKTAFDLGCVQINLEGLNEQNTPKLICSAKNPTEVIFARSDL